MEKLIFEIGSAGRKGYSLPKLDVPDAEIKSLLPADSLRKKEPELPEVSELDCVRHFTRLSQLNFSIDTNFYPLGSCTMKYNPKFTEAISRFAGFANLHPIFPQLRSGEFLAQGALEVLYEMDRLLSEMTGMDDFTMQPLAGAHGELTGVMLMAAYHRSKGNKKKYIIIPDSAHGTNPASAAIAGYETISIPSNLRGGMDMKILKEKLTDEVAGGV